MSKWLLDRGYKEQIIKEQICRAKNLNRDDLLQDRVRDRKGRENTRDVLVLTYHPALNKKVYKILNDNFNILQHDTEHKQLFTEKPLVSFRRAKSLKDLLVRARLPDLGAIHESGCRGCRGRRDCRVCGLIEESTTFSNKNNERSYNIRQGPLHCNSKNVVYLMQCKTCNKQYVGSCTTEFRKRVNNYKTQHRNYASRAQAGTLAVGRGMTQTSLHAHFHQDDHSGFEDWSFGLIDSAPNEDTLRRKREVLARNTKCICS